MNQWFYFLVEQGSNKQTVGEICGMIPAPAVALMGTLYNIIKIAVPLILIIYGMLDFGKAVMAKEEKEIKEKQKLFIKRVISAVMVFLVLYLVQFVMTIISPKDNSIMTCVNNMLGVPTKK